MNRRGFLRGAGLILAAPAIVKVSALMPISAPKPAIRPIVWMFEPTDPIMIVGDWNYRELIRIMGVPERMLAKPDLVVEGIKVRFDPTLQPEEVRVVVRS